MLSANHKALAVALEFTLGETEQSPLIAGNSDEVITTNTFALKASYEFHPTWRVETAYEYYAVGDGTYLTDSEGIINEAVFSSAFLLGVKKSYILTERFTVNVRLGYSIWNINYDIEFEDHSADFSYTDNGITASYTQLTMHILQPDENIQSDNVSNLYLSVDSDRENEIGNISLGIGYIF